MSIQVADDGSAEPRRRTGLHLPAIARPEIPRIILLVIAVMVADLFLGDLDIGPASARIYLLALAAAATLYLLVNGRLRLFSSGLSLALAVTYGGFLAWVTFNTLLRGGDFSGTINQLGSTLLFGWVLYVVAQAAMKSRRDVFSVSAALALTAIATALVASLQWFGFDPAWDLTRSLRPDEQFDSFKAVPGLSLFSISLSYHLLIGGALIAGGALWWPKRPILHSGLNWAAVSVIALALVFALARSAILAAALIAVLFTLIHLFRRPGAGKRGSWKYPAAFVVTFAVTVGIFVSVAGPPSELGNTGYPARESRYGLDRLRFFSSPERVALLHYAWDSWLDSPFIGDNPAYVEGYPLRVAVDDDLSTKPQAPHNMVLNTLIFYGAIGGVIMAGFLVLLAVLAVRTVRKAYKDPLLGPLAVATSLGLVAFLFNAQFHNESFVSGSTLGFWLVAILTAIERAAISGQSDR